MTQQLYAIKPSCCPRAVHLMTLDFGRIQYLGSPAASRGRCCLATYFLFSMFSYCQKAPTADQRSGYGTQQADRQGRQPETGASPIYHISHIREWPTKNSNSSKQKQRPWRPQQAEHQPKARSSQCLSSSDSQKERCHARLNTRFLMVATREKLT